MYVHVNYLVPILVAKKKQNRFCGMGPFNWLHPVDSGWFQSKTGQLSAIPDGNPPPWKIEVLPVAFHVSEKERKCSNWRVNCRSGTVLWQSARVYTRKSRRENTILDTEFILAECQYLYGRKRCDASRLEKDRPRTRTIHSVSRRERDELTWDLLFPPK